MKNILAAAFSMTAALFLGGCASSSQDITPAYVSPLTFHAFDCSQLAAEQQRLSVRAVQIGARLDQAAQRDKVLVAVLLPYSAFFIGGNKEREAEFARIKGESDAIEQASIAKKCTLTPLPASAASAAG